MFQPNSTRQHILWPTTLCRVEVEVEAIMRNGRRTSERTEIVFLFFICHILIFFCIFAAAGRLVLAHFIIVSVWLRASRCGCGRLIPFFHSFCDLRCAYGCCMDFDTMYFNVTSRVQCRSSSSNGGDGDTETEEIKWKLLEIVISHLLLFFPVRLVGSHSRARLWCCEERAYVGTIFTIN